MHIRMQFLRKVFAKRLATVVGSEEGKAENKNTLVVSWIDPNLTKIKRTGIDIAGSLPGLPAVLGAKNAAAFAVNVRKIVSPAFVALHHCHDNFRIRRCHREAGFSCQSRQAIAAFFPCSTTIRTFENPTHVLAVGRGDAVPETPWCAAASVKCGVDYFGIIRRHRYVDTTDPRAL